MGCDIHWCVEVRSPAGWVGVLENTGYECPAAGRNYRFFAELAGVRSYDDGDYPKPKGLPEGISQLAKLSSSIGSWDHSHSWCSLSEFQAAYNRAADKYNPPQEHLSVKDLLGLSWWAWGNAAEARIVFAFDN